MAQYIPIEDIDNYISNGETPVPEVDRFHLQLSEVLLEFTKANQSKTLVITNIGWDKLPLKRVVVIGSEFVVEQSLPSILLPKVNYFINVTYNTEATEQINGGLYVDVGDSYGDKFVSLSGNL